MIQITRHNQTFLLGIDWRIAQDKADAKRIEADLPAKPKAKLMIRDAGSDQTILGFVHESFRPANRKRPPVAGAWVAAQLLESAIVAVRLTAEGQFWACVLQDRAPVPGMDRIVQESELDTLISEWMELFVSMQIVGDIEGAVSDSEDLWQSMADAVRAKQIPKNLLRQATVNPPIGTRDLVLAGVAVALLAGVSYGGYLAWQQWGTESTGPQMIDPAKLAAERERLLAELAKEEAHRAAVEQFQSRFEQTYRQYRALVDQSPLGSWAQVYQQMPSVMLGYQLSKMDCDRSACQLAWQQGQATRWIPTLIADKYRLPGDWQGDQGQDRAARTSIPVALHVRPDAVPVLPADDEWIDKYRESLLDLWAVRMVGVQPGGDLGISIDPAVRPIMVSGAPDAGIPDLQIGNELAIYFSLPDVDRFSELAQAIRGLPVALDQIEATVNRTGSGYSVDRYRNIRMTGRLIFLESPEQIPTPDIESP